MDLTINLVSSICWEIIAKLPLRLNNQTLPVFKLLLDGVYDFSPPFSESRWKIYWRRSPGDYLEITDYFSLCSFVNLAAVPELYLVIGDAEKFYADTEKFLRMLDLMELKRVKELRRSKYDLKSEADVIEEQIEECRTTLNDPVVSTIEYKNDTDVINFALRNMPMGRCYTADICSGYNLIDCVRKGWPKTKKVLAPLPDEVIERKIKKEKEGKKGGKGDKAKGKENAKSEADKSKTKKTKS